MSKTHETTLKAGVLDRLVYQNPDRMLELISEVELNPARRIQLLSRGIAQLALRDEEAARARLQALAERLTARG